MRLESVEPPARPRRFRKLAGLLLVVVGCTTGDAESSTSGFEVTDSAGITVLTNSQPERRLDLVEVLRVGVVEGDEDLQFDRIRSLSLDPAGGFWVVDSNESIRHYDQNGALVGRVGGEGSGPGEAQAYGAAWAGTGRVLALGLPGIIQEFSEAGSLLASRNTRTGNGAAIRPLGAAESGWMLSLRSFPPDATGPTRWSVTAVRAAESMSEWDTLGTFAGEMYVPLADGHVVRGSYFLGSPTLASDHEGRLYVSDSLSYRIERYDRDGQLDRVLVRGVEPRLYDPAWPAEIEDGVRAASTGADEDAVRRLTSIAVPEDPPEHLPFIGEMLLASDGTIWVERPDRHPRPPMAAVAHAFGYIRHAWRPEWVAPQVFDVFAPGGEYRGTVEVPSHYAVMAVGPDRIYGVWYDDLDVEFVVAYELQESPRS